MAYKNIVFIKLEKRLLNDYRWYTLSESAQLIYIKLILLAAETYNKIPKSEPVLRQALRSTLEPNEFHKALEEVKNNFHKFMSSKYYYYFKEFESKTNYVKNRELLSNRSAIAKTAVDKEEEKDKEEDKEKDKEYKKTFFNFEKIWSLYPSKVGKDSALKKFKSSVKTEQDYIDIQTALNNYINSKRVKAGYVQNGSTWFKNWRDWIINPEIIKLQKVNHIKAEVSEKQKYNPEVCKLIEQTAEKLKIKGG